MHIFGTAHEVAIDILPPAVTSFIMEHESLVTESEDLFRPITFEELVSYNFVLLGEDISPLLNFADHQQKVIREKIQPYLDFKKSKIPVDKLNLHGLFNLYQMALYFEDGIDYSIIRGFLAKNITGLESIQDVVNIQELEISEEGFKELVYSSDCKIAERKFVKFFRDNLYLGNLKLKEDGDSSSNELLTRNSAWLPKIKELDSSEVICVGFAHLFYEHGILNMLKLGGYSIERMSSSGEFTMASDVEILQGIKLATAQEYQNMLVLSLKKLNLEERQWVKNNSEGEYEASFLQLYAEENVEYCASSEQIELAGAEYQAYSYCES